MVNSSLIQSAAFSIWLNDLNTNRGSILFGGVDTDKYYGTLQTIPNLQINTNGATVKGGLVEWQFYIELTGLTITNSSETKSLSFELPIRVILDLPAL